MARDISSDYEQAQLLTAVAPMSTGKEQAIQPFFDAVATIKSDYERSRVIKSIVKDTPSTRVARARCARRQRWNILRITSVAVF